MKPTCGAAVSIGGASGTARGATVRVCCRRTCALSMAVFLLRRLPFLEDGVGTFEELKRRVGRLSDRFPRRILPASPTAGYEHATRRGSCVIN